MGSFDLGNFDMGGLFMMMGRHRPMALAAVLTAGVTAGVWTVGVRAQTPPAPTPQTAPAAAAASGQAQDDWKPEKLVNLKVLPKTTTPDQIVAIMKSYTEALNVGCVFCHKGQVGAAYATFDFADDAKERKAVTRSMILMTRDINTKYPDGMEDASEEAPKVTCATCHRRNRHPELDLPPKAAKAVPE